MMGDGCRHCAESGVGYLRQGEQAMGAAFVSLDVFAALLEVMSGLGLSACHPSIPYQS